MLYSKCPIEITKPSSSLYHSLWFLSTVTYWGHRTGIVSVLNELGSSWWVPIASQGDWLKFVWFCGGGCTYMQVNAHVCMFAGVHVCTPTHTHMWGYVCVHSCEDREQLNHSSGAIHLVLLLQSLSLVWNSAMSPGRLTTEPRVSPLLGSPNAASTGDLDALFRMSYLLSPNRCFSFVCSFFVLGSHVSLYKLQRGIAFVCQLSRFHGRQIHQESSESFPYRLTHNSPE